MFYWQADRPYTAKQIKQIFLDRKASYNPEEISKAIVLGLRQSGVEKQPEVRFLEDPIPFGSVNIVCPFETKEGYRGIIRAFPSQVDNGYYYVEKEAMRAAGGAGASVPEVRHVSLEKSEVPFNFMIMDRVPGTVMQIEVERDPSLYRQYLVQVGEEMARIHSVGVEGYGFFDNNLAKGGRLGGQYNRNEEHFIAALDRDEEFYQDKEQWVDIALIARALAILRKNSGVAKCDKPVLVHNDIADWNIVVERKKVAGILDWDECFGGDPVFDFATARLFYPDERFDYLLEGYKRVRDLPADYDDKFALYELRYIISKSKISIKKLMFVEKPSTRERFEISMRLLSELVSQLE